MDYVGVDIPDEAETDWAVDLIIRTFLLANRSRRYISGMSIVALPLSVEDITNVLAAHPVILGRELLDTCVFAIDDEYLTMALS